MPKEKATVVMKSDKKCKSCVRFRGEGEESDTVGSSFYLQNDAFEKLEKPSKIRLTVEAAT